MPDYLPNIARLIYIHTDSKDFPSALEYAKKLVELDKTNIFPKASKDYRLWNTLFTEWRLHKL